MKPMFISVEGTEGSGKSTMLPYIQKALQKTFDKVNITRAPGGTAIGERIRDVLKTTFPNETLTRESQLLLFLVDRLQQIDSVIIPQMLQGNCIVTDRYLDSTEVLQCRFGGVKSLYHAVCDSPSMECIALRPDYTLFFKASPHVARKRLTQRELINDPLDELHSDYRVVNLWERHFNELKSLGYEDRVFIINADLAVEDVIHQVDNVILNISGHWLSQFGAEKYSFLDEWQACSSK